MKELGFCFWFVREPRWPVSNRDPPSSWIGAHLSLSTTDSTRFRWARDSLLSPASSALSHPPNLLCFQAITLLTHCPRYSWTDCRQDEAFPKVRWLHLSKVITKAIIISPMHLSVREFTVRIKFMLWTTREDSFTTNTVRLWSIAPVPLDWSHNSGCR